MAKQKGDGEVPGRERKAPNEGRFAEGESGVEGIASGVTDVERCGPMVGARVFEFRAQVSPDRASGVERRERTPHEVLDAIEREDQLPLKVRVILFSIPQQLPGATQVDGGSSRFYGRDFDELYVADGGVYVHRGTASCFIPLHCVTRIVFEPS